MSRTILQVPLPTSLRQTAEKRARQDGFSSLQEVIRLFLKKYSQKQVSATFINEEEQLSPKAAKRYAKMIADIKSGQAKLYRYDTMDEYMKFLSTDDTIDK
jgi:hypothetical protein